MDGFDAVNKSGFDSNEGLTNLDTPIDKMI